MSASVRIFLQALKTVAQIMVVAGVGVILARRGILTAERSKSIATISVNLFLPCLIFTDMLYCEQCMCDTCPKRAGTCRACPYIHELVLQSWFLFLWPLVVVGVGFMFGKIVARFCRCSDELGAACVVAVSFGNSTGLPVVILQVTRNSLLAEGILAEDPLLFLPMYLILYPVLQWTLGDWLLRQSSPASLPVVGTVPEVGFDDQITGASNDRVPSTTFPLSTHICIPGFWFQMCDWMHVQIKPSARCVAAESKTAGIRSSELDLPEDGRCDFDVATSHDMAQDGPSQDRFQYCWRAVDFLRKAFSPVVVAVLLALIIGSLPLRTMLVDVNDQDDDADLGFFYSALRQLAGAAVPCQLLVVGSSLAKGPTFTNGTKRLHIAIALTKMVLVPMALVGIVALMGQVGILSSKDRAAVLVMLLVGATPSANNLILMLEVAGSDKTVMATSIFVQYILAPVLLTAWLAIFPMLLVSSSFLPTT